MSTKSAVRGHAEKRRIHAIVDLDRNDDVGSPACRPVLRSSHENHDGLAFHPHGDCECGRPQKGLGGFEGENREGQTGGSPQRLAHARNPKIPMRGSFRRTLHSSRAMRPAPPRANSQGMIMGNEGCHSKRLSNSHHHATPGSAGTQ